ncbi:MAG TPA: AI-2E family transporter [Candidatus Paceibacterota bacterium]
MIENSRSTISISTGSVVKVILLILFVWLLFVIKDIILIVLVSVVIASAIEPAVRFLSRYHIPRTPAVLIVYLVTFALLVSLIPFFFIPALKDLTNASATLPQKIDSLSFLSAPDGLFSTLSRFSYFDNLSSNLEGAFAGVSRGFIETVSIIFGGFFSFVMIVVISFYLSVQDDGIANFLRAITPARSESYIIGLWHRAQKKIGLWMQGQLLLGLLVGVIVYLGLTILKIEYALVLAIMAAIFELIPVFGPILSAVPAILIGFSHNASTGLLVLGLYLVIQQFENHLLYPLVVKKIVGVPSIVVILALIIGAKLVGFLGIILAVPISAVFIELLSDFEQRKKTLHRDAV